MDTQTPRTTRSLRLLLAILFALAAGLQAQEQGGQIGVTREAMQKWVETKSLISKEKREWALAKEMLKSQIELVQAEIDGLKQKIAESEKTAGESGKEKARLEQEAARLETAGKGLAELIVPLEERIKQLLPQLPIPLQDRVKPVSQQLPKDSKKSEISLGNRFAFVVEILKAADKANREISVESQLQKLSTGRSAEVAVLYVGLSKAYYVSPDGKYAGVGNPSPEGWIWTHDDAAAGRIATAVAMFRNEQIAGFVPLPVRLDRKGVK